MPCTCAGVNNQHNEGAECKQYRGYSDEWYNGLWCYASTAVCSDAQKHASDTLPGYGASRSACSPGIIFHIYF